MQQDMGQMGPQGGPAEPGSLSQAAQRMDPAEVQRSIRELSARIRQLEDQAKQVSAPFLMESVLREAGDLRLQSVKAAERTYNDAVEAAEQEAKRILDEAEQRAASVIEEAQAEGERRAQEYLEQARQEADRIRRGAIEAQTQTRHELERVSAEFNTFVKRLIERTATEHAATEAIAEPEPEPIRLSMPTPMIAPAAAAPAAPVAPIAPAAAPEVEAELEDEAPAPLGFGIGHDDPWKGRFDGDSDGESDSGFASFDTPASTSNAPDADWGADWAEQLKRVPSVEPAPARGSEPVAEIESTEAKADEPKSVEAQPAAPTPKEGFKLPSWLPSWGRPSSS